MRNFMKRFKLRASSQMEGISFCALPLEIVVHIFSFIPKTSLLRLWEPLKIKNKKVHYALCYHLLSKIYIYNMSMLELKRLFHVKEKQWALWRHHLNEKDGTKHSTYIMLAIYRFAKMNHFDISPRKICLLFSLTSTTGYLELTGVLDLLDTYMENALQNIKIYIKIDNTVQVPFNLPHLQALQISNCPSGISNLSGFRLTELILDGDIRGVIYSFPKCLQNLAVNPSKRSFGHISMSLSTLPPSLNTLLLGEYITINDYDVKLPHLSFVISRMGENISQTFFHEFLKNNSLSVKYLQLKHYSFLSAELNTMENLRMLFLWQCTSIPYYRINCLTSLTRLWLLECDLDHIDLLTIPTMLRDMRVAPCNQELLKDILPDYLKNRVKEGKWTST
ncbi:Piso0_001727 [Millerozyma farinosa CBS 7064]|uniref:Piso0_001727 protein n=1 Tax=Pichia sorbitophila (strain ATCC MYA-4447 / BCRC 22081 / CBS 7064 / NBRC 10061 / NRRL Y-12695) TaxID=559304 RepID=G8YNX8_PICSO|nr:Piso0_001727 [Millerozyma farinosa CBS 7064]